MTLTNGMPIGVPEAVNAYFMDLVIGGGVENDWLSLYEQATAQLYVNPSKLAGKKPPQHPAPAQPDSFYAGTYHSDFYGTITVVARGGALDVLMPPKPTGYRLEHWDGNLFAFFPVGENAVGISAAAFAPGRQNDRAATLTLEYYNNYEYPDGTGIGIFIRQ